MTEDTVVAGDAVAGPYPDIAVVILEDTGAVTFREDIADDLEIRQTGLNIILLSAEGHGGQQTAEEERQ